MHEKSGLKIRVSWVQFQPLPPFINCLCQTIYINNFQHQKDPKTGSVAFFVGPSFALNQEMSQPALYWEDTPRLNDYRRLQVVPKVSWWLQCPRAGDSMKHKVSADVLNKTTKCENNFSCLETGKCGGREMCEAESIAGNCVIFLKPENYTACPYRVPFGDSQVCRCPTHYAILKAFAS